MAFIVCWVFIVAGFIRFFVWSGLLMVMAAAKRTRPTLFRRSFGRMIVAAAYGTAITTFLIQVDDSSEQQHEHRRDREKATGKKKSS